MTHGRIVYGPAWPDPADVVGFLEQTLQFTRAAIADQRPFQPQRAVVLLIDDREDGYELADLVHNCPAMRVSSRRFERALDPAGEFDPEG